VGKTELVKQLATDLFNTPDALIRLDMSEFMDKYSVSRIVGSPPGYVGYDEAGQLTEKDPPQALCRDPLRRDRKGPSGRAEHPAADPGRRRDHGRHGRKVNFENTIIVMTSNAGSNTKEGSVGFGRSVSEQDKEKAMKALNEFLRPEFINRVDEVVCFNRLSEENFRNIARIMMDELTASLKDF
jgi:ATP-dependent Clp protease ATP-binding subunit ClpC